MSQFRVIAISLVFWLLCSGVMSFHRLSAQEVADQSQEARELDQFLTELAIQHLPVPHVEDKDWNKTDERWDGIRVYRNSKGRLTTKRRKKTVNHGTWKKYTVDLIDPKKNFHVTVSDFQEHDDGDTSFVVGLSARVQIHARQSKWVKGLQLYSLSVDGKADVVVAVNIRLATELVPTKFPPDLILKPKAESADLQIRNFRIDRVSKAGGEFAQQLTRAVKSQLEEKVTKYEGKIVKKLNKSFEKKKDHLTLSLHDAMQSKWAKLMSSEKDEEKE